MSPSRGDVVMWWSTRVALPIVGLALLAFAIGRSSFDRASLVPFFDVETGVFPMRRDWFFEDVLHIGGKYFVLVFTALLAIGAVIGWRKPRWSEHARRAAYLVLCFLATVGIAGAWKELANQVTPWDTIGFGGKKIWPGSLGRESIWDIVGSPGAHASSGFAWISLFFVGASLGARSRWPWLAPGLLLGLLFALGQHTRGAHQPSHEPWSMAIAWLVACAFALLFRRLGLMSWSEIPTGGHDGRSERLDSALPWIVGSSIGFCGVAFFATDMFTEQVDKSYPRIHAWFEVVELSVTALGLGIGGWLLTEKILSMRRREKQSLEAERERRFQVLGRMAASVAHEVRNPLQTVRLIVDEQRHEVAGLRDHPLQAEFESCLERIDRAVDLVYRLARPESGEADRVDLALTTRESVVALSRIAPDRVRFVWEREPPQAIVNSSRSALRIVIDNLLRNAVEASPDGGTVELGLREHDDSWTLDIRNRGSLSAPKSVGGSSPARGLGLGVPISRQIAGNAGGGIEMNERDGFVTCTLRWPRAEEVEA